MKGLIVFIKECIAEFKKIVWPSKESVSSSVKVVLISTVVTALLLALIDILIGNTFFALLGV